MSQAMSQDHALSRACHGKPNASKTHMHGHLDIHDVPCCYSKAQGCRWLTPVHVGSKNMVQCSNMKQHVAWT